MRQTVSFRKRAESSPRGEDDQREEGARRAGRREQTRPRGGEESGEAEVRHDEHHGQEEGDRAEVDGGEGFRGREGAEGDEEDGEGEGHRCAVHAEPRQASRRYPAHGQRDEDERCDLFHEGTTIAKKG